MSEGTGKPDKISLDDVLGQGGGVSRQGEEDGIIEVTAGSEPGSSDGDPRDGGDDSTTGRQRRQEPATEQDPGAAQVEELLSETLREKERVQDMYMRARADLENFRKRVERDREEDRVRSIAAVAGEILPAIDNLDRALAQPADTPGFREGVALIRKQIEDAFRKLGLVPIDTLGEPFDPALHEAVSVEPREGFAPNTIIEEIRRGYVLRGRVLRPALVKVVAAGPPAESREAPGESDGPNHRD